MAYDAARQEVVAFGAHRSGETFIWDGTSWRTRNPAGNPGFRFFPAMAYDSVRQEIVLFGGFIARGSACDADFDDTWIWDGAEWSQRVVPGPPRRGAAKMAFDAARRQTVLFGGVKFCEGGEFRQTFRNDTWLWDGAAWAAPLLVQPDPVIDMSVKPDGIWNYTSIDIPAGVDVRFKKNAANTPVVWLASGDANIAGGISLDGANTTADVSLGNEAPGGPGGFAGGLGGRRFDVSGSFAGTPGAGPGGGLPGTAVGQRGGDGGYGIAGDPPLGGSVYGNPLIEPLVGGSGGGGAASTDTADGFNGGGGGGALLVASATTIRVDGAIHANGGTETFGRPGAGSGGAIRLVANRIEGAGTLSARGGRQVSAATGTAATGDGRIRTETFFLRLTRQTGPPSSAAPPIALHLANSGRIRITSVAGKPVAQPPGGDTNAPDVVFSEPGTITIDLATTNIPSGTLLTVRVTTQGQILSARSTPTSSAGNATATLTVPKGVGTIQAFAEYAEAP
jgi:hypothetical protein